MLLSHFLPQTALAQLEAKLSAVTEQNKIHEDTISALHQQLRDREANEVQLREDYNKLRDKMTSNDTEKERRREREKFERERIKFIQELDIEHGKVTLRDDMIKRLEKAIKDRDTELDRLRAQVQGPQEPETMTTPLIQAPEPDATSETPQKGCSCVIS